MININKMDELSMIFENFSEYFSREKCISIWYVNSVMYFNIKVLCYLNKNI